MSFPLEDSLSSEPFLIIGPSGAKFYAHGGLLSSHSPVFRTEIEGETKEAKTKTIEIGEIDGDIDDNTIAQFINFVYRGDYSVPTTQFADDDSIAGIAENCAHSFEATARNFSQPDRFARQPEFEDGVPEFFGETQDDYSWGFPSKQARKKKKSSFHTDPDPPVQVKQPQKILDASSLIYHARLYVFSYRYESTALRKVCIQRVRIALSDSILTTSGISDIVNLTKYVYTHTIDRGQETNELCDLVTGFVTQNIKALVGDSEFLELLGLDNVLAKDLVIRLASKMEQCKSRIVF